MNPRTPTYAPTDRTMWRRLLALSHPDGHGDHELFVWASALREHVAGDYVEPPMVMPRYSPSRHRDSDDGPERIPFDPDLGYVDEFVTLTMRALSVGQHVEEPYRSVLLSLIDCDASDHGRRADKQARGASWRQLAYVAHLAGFDKVERYRWYEIARAVPLAEAHASHLIGSLTRQAAA